MKQRAKVTVHFMRDAVSLTADHERMRRRHGAAVKASPAPVYSPAQSVEVEQHFTPGEIAKQWGISTKTVRRMFANTPGVLKLGTKGKHVSLRIPGRLLKAHHAKLSACRKQARIDRKGPKARVKVNLQR
jgi:hypothetical protein